ncbi:MAG: short-chain dehydrogenase, partial [Bdellovibrionia bacterium]
SYRMSKAALNMFNKSFAVDHPEIISVVMHPGWVQTRMGGNGAPITPSVSVAGMNKFVSSLKLSDSGKFFNYDGKSLPF